MNQNLIDITLVLDRSGSMEIVRDDTIGGTNSFIEQQKQGTTDVTFTLVQFDNQYEFVHKAAPMKTVPPLNRETYQPRGSTALLDAIGRAINETGARLAAMPENERPAKVLFIIQTDGQENSSKEFTHSQIASMITHQREKYSWEFIYLGANQDAIATGTSYGISAGKSLKYASNAIGSASAFRS